ncbi:hypothetical protein pb186bvf_018214 [Paramecium bursaria]
MFLNAENFDNEPQPQSNRGKQRFASNRFQAKQNNEAPKEPPKEAPVSRIQQKQMEIMKQPQVVDFQIETPTQQQQEQEQQQQQESILNFDSDEDDSNTQNLIEQRNQSQLQQQLAYQQKLKESNFGVQQNQIYFNSSQKYGDEDIDLNKLTYAGNNHNKPHEPGQQFEEHDLPQLKKEDQKQILQQSYVKFLDEQQKKSESESEDEEHHHNQEKMEQLEQNQMIKKELQQQNEKVLVEEEQEIVQESQELRMEQEEPQQTKSLCPYPKAMTNVPMPDGKKYFLTNPCPQGGMIQCTIKRDKSGFGRFYPSYHIHFSNGFLYLMSAKKRACNNTSNYLIAMSKSDMTAKQNFLGKVRSNFIGTEFILYDSGKNPKKTKHPEEFRQQLGVVLYESNILGSKGPRKMQVLLPKVDSKSGQPYIYKPASSKDGILKDFREKNMKNLVSFINRPPQWNSKHKAFVLNFYQRVDKPSVKNFQLVVEDGEDNILLQFGRVGTDLFNLDFQYPLSPLQAFEIALSSFDYKIACE